nr:RNA-directed DNA polymerase, eukaryota [Tanacetum cinerariifolium]
MITSVGNNSIFRSFFEKQKLTGPNFIDWYRQLRLVLSTKNKENYLEHHIPAAPVALPGQQVPSEALAAHAAWVKGQKEVDVLMLFTMDLEIQRNLAHLGAYDMLQELKALCLKQAEQELLQTVREFHTCKQEEVSLNKDFDSFVQNYNMHGMGKTVNELHAMLKLHEETLPKKNANPALHAIRARSVQKNQKNKLHKAAKGGHGCGTHICITTQGLRESKKLKPGALSMYVGDGHRATVEAIRTYHLELLSGLVIVLNNCHYAPSITRGVISVSRLFDNGFINRFDDNNVISVSKNNLVYFMAVPRDGSSLLWHCRLGHISKKRIEKLQHDGLLNSIDIESLEKCVSFMSERMARKPYSHQVERAKDLLGLIYTDEHELGDLGEPANYKVALLDPESKKWLDAMNVEMQSMKDNDVWVLVEIPPNARTVGSKWLFKKKTDIDGALYIFKARLVAKGFTQTYGVDYEETFSPVADIRAIRILIAIAAYYDYEIYQMDVKTAFLNRHLSKKVYMEQPEGFVNPKYPNHKFGFTQNRDEPCVYLKASGSYIAILILYVDDILLMGNNIIMLQDVKLYLGRSFAMKDLGNAVYILGIKIYRDRSKRLIGLCQKAYIEKILKIYYMKNSKRETIPMQEKLKLSKSQGALTPAEKHRMQNIPYALAVGSIMYDVRCTCLDVAFAQNMTSRFQQNLGKEHWTAVKNILKYLRNTKDMFLVYGDLICEAVWIRKFISGLGIVPTIEEPISMYCDNTGAITIAKDDGVTKGARHFHAKVHYLRETIKLGDVKIEKIDTDDNLADPFTKALAFLKHSELTRNIGLLPASSFIVNNRYFSKKDQTQKISKSIFIANFPDHFSVRNLWNVCVAYGKVVDVFIPFKRSKAGKKFTFVRFISVDNLDLLIGNLCTIWIRRFKLHANKVRNPNAYWSPAFVLDDTCIMEHDFSRSLLGKIKDINALFNLYFIIANEGFGNVKLSYLGGHWVLLEMDSVDAKEKIIKHVGVGSWFVELKHDSNSFVCEERLMWVTIKGLPVKGLTRITFAKIISSWGELVKIDDSDNRSLSYIRVCVKTKPHVLINNMIKIIIKGQLHLICVKELEAWIPEFITDKKEGSTLDGESERANENDIGIDKENKYDHVLKTSFTPVVEDDVVGSGNSPQPTHVGSQEDGINPGNIMSGNKVNESFINSKHNHGTKFQASGSILEVMDELIKSWSSRKGFDKMVEDLWKNYDNMDSNSIKKLKNKLRFLKTTIKLWLAEDNKKSNANKQSIMSRLTVLDKSFDQGKCNDELLQERSNLFKELHDLNNASLLDLTQKAKIRWAIKDDENSKFFHGIVNKKRSQLAIHGVLVDGDWIIDPSLLSPDQVIDLESSVACDEIKHTFWDCGTNKSFGPDGFTFEFFQKYWKIIDHDVVAAVSPGSFPPGCSSSFIALIPKKQEAKMVKYFCPISLIGSVYKIITKVLANRLSHVISNLVSNVQSAFVSDRKILDGPFILNELLLWCKHKNSKALIFRIDFEKVFDLVRRDYLDVVLSNFGFGTKWRSWIQGCLNSTMGSIIVNCSPTSEFKFSKGLKQGDPLSPFLFILIIESLHLSFNNVVNAGLFKGLKINLHKSKLMSIGISQDVVASTARSIGCSTLHMPFNYLSVKVGGTMSKISSWDDVVAKLSSRLSKWKLKNLSIGGRLTLIKSVLSSLPLYFMSSFKKVLASKKNGGLGVSSFFAMNRALLFKWVWMFIANGSSLWSRFITSIHGIHGGLDCPLSFSKCSPWIDIVREVKKLSIKGIDLLSLIKKKVGNGETTSFWDDVWLGDSPLKHTYPRPPQGGVEEEQLLLLISDTSTVILPNISDRWT